MKWSEPTAEQNALWTEWLAARPEHVRVVAERFDPWTMYRMKHTGQKARFLGCDVGARNCGETDVDPMRVTIRVYVENLILGSITRHNVFGVLPDDIEPWA